MASNGESSSPKKKITLKTADGEIFEVDEAVAFESETIKIYFEDDVPTDTIVPLPNVTSGTLVKVLEYCKNHIEFRSKNAPEEEIKAFEAEFVKEDNTTIINLVLAANYLDIKGLLDFINQTVAGIIKNYSVEQVRDFFGIENDYTHEEEQEVREQNNWAFE